MSVGCRFLGGDGSGGVGDSGRDGVDGSDSGLKGGPPAPPPCRFFQGRGKAGMASHCNLLVSRAGLKLRGLPSAGQVVVSAGSPFGSSGAVVFGSRTGLHQVCGGGSAGQFIFREISRGVKYIDCPKRPAEAYLDHCGQMPVQKILDGAGGKWPPVTSRPGNI